MIIETVFLKPNYSHLRLSPSTTPDARSSNPIVSTIHMSKIRFFVFINASKSIMLNLAITKIPISTIPRRITSPPKAAAALPIFPELVKGT
ncbi:hypothetical protein GWN43_01320 [Candidatus Bathyarchaeota archaeon]|nr:hypothetical protein [Candidatus Bathyarchaeota archaeon]NIV67486.1 hypothetical protein [Candidatus Bathyarchaeota archaeon]